MFNNRFQNLKRVKVAPLTLEILHKVGDSVVSVDETTGELFTFTGNKQDLNADNTLADKYALQSVARLALKGYRVAKCQRLPISKLHHISVYKSKFDSAFFGGLQTCGSVWHCPVCAAKISERRVSEVQQAIDYTQLIGGFVSFVTRTVPHTHNDSLKEILVKFRKAEEYLKGNRNYKKCVSNFSIFGTIKVFEITVGINGWHLHVHEICLHKPVVITDIYTALESRMYMFWAVAAVKAGFECPSRAHGLQVQNGDFAADYLAKYGRPTSSNWTVSREVTKQHIKKAKAGFSPFDLMRAYRDSPSDFLLGLITEYGQSMHGARQLIWSRGLKKLVQVEEISDVEIAEKLESESILLGLISLNQWRFIIKNDYRATVLIIAKNQGWSELSAFLSAIGAPPFTDIIL